MIGGMIMIGDAILRWRCITWMPIHFGMVVGAAARRWRLSMITVGIIHSLLFCATTSRWHSFSLSYSLISLIVAFTQLESIVFSLPKKCEYSLFNYQDFRLSLSLDILQSKLFFPLLLSITIFFSPQPSFFLSILLDSRDCCCIVVYVVLFLPSK